MITSSRISDFLLESEKDFPVKKWKYKDISLWPLIRILAFSALKNENTASMPVKGNWVYKIFNRIISYLNYFKFILLYKPGFTLFISFEEHFFNHNRKTFNKFYELIIRIIKKQPLGSFFIIEFRNSSTLPIRMPHMFKKTIGNYIFDLNKNTQFNEKEIFLENFDKFIYSLKASFPELTVESRSLQMTNIVESIRFLQYYSTTWENILTRKRPKIIYTSCHYFIQNFGMTLAANKLNIPVVEIQHGNVNNYPPYCMQRSSNVLYQMLPNFFWCWNLASYNALANTYFNSHYVKSINLGNPWEEILKDKEWTKRNIGYSKLDQYKKKKPIILYTLVSGEEFFPKKLKMLYGQTKDSFVWWVRLHPRQLRSYDMISDEASRLGFDPELLKIATNEPLPFILPYVDLHITSLSSVVLEAQEYNIKSIVLTKEGWDRYHEIVEDLLFFDDDLEIDSLLNKATFTYMKKEVPLPRNLEGDVISFHNQLDKYYTS